VNDPSHPPTPLSQLPRSLTAGEMQVSQSANEFAFRLFKQLSATQPNENVFVSPLSVSFSLGMAMNGASGTTLDEMRSTLGFGAAELAQINDGYRGLMALEAGLDPSTTFEIANSVWYRQTLTVNQSFIDQVKQTFDAEVRASPFDASTISQVNGWVNDRTHGKIPTILDKIDADNVMFLINAIYFKGSWREQFDPADTQDGPFAALDGTQTVKLMHRNAEGKTLPLSSTESLTVGELTYGNSAFVMTVLMPTSGNDVNGLAASLDTAAWRATLAGLHEVKADVSLPKLKLEYKRELSTDLQALGMRVPFMPDIADFSAMSPVGRQLYISFVMHKTFVNVDEVGTEAAAVTNTGISLTSLPPCLCVQRPFIFAIRERFSGTILFIGKIVRIPASS
jgi:serpin B